MVKLPDFSNNYSEQTYTPPAAARTGIASYKAGQVGEAIAGVGNTAIDLVGKQEAIQNQTLAMNADTDFAMKAGKIKADYMSLSGLSAHDAFPQYQEDIKKAYNDSRATLPPAARLNFDMSSSRSMTSHIIDGSGYAASQFKEANRDAASSYSNVKIQEILDPNIAANPDRVNANIKDAIQGSVLQLDRNQPGFRKDPETGNVSFDESTPEGKNLKENLQRNIDGIVTQAQVNRFDTLSKQNVFGAYDTYIKERDKLPRSAQVSLDAMFAPKMMLAHTQVATTSALDHAANDHYDMLTNPLSVRNNNPGNLRDQSTGQFRIFDTPEEGAAAMQADLTAKINGNSPAMERNFGKGYSPTLSNVITTWAPASDKNDPKAYTNTVSKETGIAPDQVLTTGDIAKLMPAMAKVEAGGTPSKPTPKYATNENGGPMSLADYYRTHSNDVLAKGDAYAEQQMPGDLTFKRSVRQSLNNEMNKVIANESQQHLMDNRKVMQAINGGATNGKTPATEDELRAIPGMADLLDTIATRDPTFSETIPVLINKANRRNDTTNSANGYGVIQRVLEPNDPIGHPNRIGSEDHLVKWLADTKGPGINMKDYNDAKQAIELDEGIKAVVSKNMTDIADANGNIDGKGQQRAVQWYNETMTAWKRNQKLGDKALSASDFSTKIGEPYGPPMPAPPSRMQQIQNWATDLFKSKSQEIPTFTNKTQFDSAPSGTVYIRDGQQYRKP